MARYPVIVDSPVKPGEVTVVRELDNNTIYLDPVGVQLLSKQNELGTTVCSVTASISDISFDTVVGSSTGDVTVSTATLTIPNTVPVTEVTVDGAAPSAITSVVFAPALQQGQVKTVIINNNAGQERTFKVFDPAVTYILPEGSDIMTLAPSHAGIISFVASSSIVVTFKGEFDV